MASPPKATKKPKQASQQQTPVANTATKHIPFWDSGVAGELLYEQYQPRYVDNNNGQQAPNDYDHITINGEVLPGIVKDGDIDVKTELHYKSNKTTGTDSNQPLLLGRRPSKISITMKIWTAQQLDATTRILKSLYPTPGNITISTSKDSNSISVNGKKVDPKSVYHPVLDMLNIKFMFITSISALKNSDVTHVKEYTIEAIEIQNPNANTVAMSNNKPSKVPKSVITGDLDKKPPGEVSAGVNSSQSTGDTGPLNYTPAQPEEQFSRAP